MQSSPHPKRLGRYEVVGVLAQGGMAELFLAQLPGIQGFAKRVVLKRVLPSLARDREFVEMFLEEARLAATLHHQNIVQVHDIGHDETGYFFTMEYLHGADVGELMRTLGAATMPLPIALEIARLACAGLHYAHQRVNPKGQPLGIVHRDVSPQNLFVTFDGNVKVLDFGIAKAVQQIANQYTRSGTLRGKLPYMSPEQCQSEKIDARSDVFSMAVVIWEMTVGRRLFGSHEQSDFDILKSIVERDAPPPSTLIADYPVELEKIVMKGLARDRNARYQTADEMQADLERFIRGTGSAITAREMGAHLRTLFADRAAASARLDVEQIAAEANAGQMIPFPGTQPVVPEVGTAEVPMGGGTMASPPYGHGHGYAPGHQTHPSQPPEMYSSQPPLRPSPRPMNPSQPPRISAPSDAAPGHGGSHGSTESTPRSGLSTLKKTFLLLFAGIGIAGLALAVGYRMRGATSEARSADGSAAATTGSAGSGSGAGSPVVVLPVSGPSDPRGKKPATIDAPRTPSSEDTHWFVPGDYLVGAKPLGNGRTTELRVAKMMSPPDENGGAVFLDARGKEVTLKHYWATHVAKPAELVVGAIAFCPVQYHSYRGMMQTSKHDMRTHEWNAGRITDTADVPNGLVHIADVVCDVAAARVPDVAPVINPARDE